MTDVKAEGVTVEHPESDIYVDLKVTGSPEEDVNNVAHHTKDQAVRAMNALAEGKHPDDVEGTNIDVAWDRITGADEDDGDVGGVGSSAMVGDGMFGPNANRTQGNVTLWFPTGANDPSTRRGTILKPSECFALAEDIRQEAATAADVERASYDDVVEALFECLAALADMGERIAHGDEGTKVADEVFDAYSIDEADATFDATGHERAGDENRSSLRFDDEFVDGGA